MVRELAEATFRLVTEAQQGIARAFDAPRVRVLQVVTSEAPVRPGTIGEWLDLAPSTVTRHVQALEDAGHLVVRPDPTDARTCLIEPTPAGLAELRGLADAGAAAFADVVADWDDTDLRTMTRLAHRLVDDWAARGSAARRRTSPKPGPRWRFRPIPATDHTTTNPHGADPAGADPGGGSPTGRRRADGELR
jgi:DNA-binding MarR family transcriptional regulator